MGEKMWSPFHVARRVFKPVPSLSSRADRLANWRGVLGFSLVIIVNSGARSPLDVIRDDIYMKAARNSTISFIVVLPVALLIMLTITRKGRRRVLVRGLGRGLRRLVVFGVTVIGSLYLVSVTHIADAVPGILQLFTAAVVVWLFVYWVCGFFWLSRTLAWIGELHPLLAPVLAVVLVVGTTWNEVSAADTKGLAWNVWLTVVLTGGVTTFLVAVAEFREVRANGITWRDGPENATTPTTPDDAGDTSDSNSPAPVHDHVPDDQPDSHQDDTTH